MEAIVQLFGLPVEELRLKVHNVFNLDDRAIQTTNEKWLMDHGIMCKEYLRRVVNRYTIVDRLFLWLSVHASQQYINVLHPGGIWTSRWSEIMVLTDATITLVVNCFLLSPKIEQFSVQDDSSFIKPLSDPCLIQDNFVIMPKVLNRPVGDVQEWLDETGLYATGPQVLLQENLSRLMECSVVDYWEQICRWLQDNAVHVPMTEKWLAVQGLNLQEYLAILGGNGASDGLEVWAASLVMNQPLNMVMADSGVQPGMVWTSHTQPLCLQATSVACSVPWMNRNHRNSCKLLIHLH